MNRCTFPYHACADVAASLGTESALTPGPALATSTLATSPSATRIVDTHTHFYDPARPEGVPWPSKDSSLYRPVYPQEWLDVAAPHGVPETVAVEASTWLEDNQWVLDLAATNTCVVGFVGHLLPHQTDFTKHLKRFAENSIFRGIRVNGDDFLENSDKAEFQSGLRLLADMGLQLDINGSRALLPSAAALAANIPALRIVLNHVGSAGDAAHLTDEWRSGMKKLGQQKNVFCKVSALLEQTDESTKRPGFAPRDTDYYKPILNHCWDCFGEDRLIYGSNWPVCEKGGSYADQLQIVSEYFGEKGREASDKYFWKNALRAYQLG